MQPQRHFLQNFRVQTAEAALDDLLQRHFGKELGNRAEQLRADFQRVKQLFRAIRHSLNQNTAGRNDVFAHQRAQRAQGRRLFGFQIIHGEILGNFAGNQRHTADIRLAKTKRTHDGQLAVFAQRAADVQLTVFLEWQLNLRVFDGHLHRAVRPCNRANRTGRTAAVDRRRNPVALALEVCTHDCRRGQHAPHRGAARVARVVDVARLLRQLGRIANKHARLTAHQRQPQHSGFLLFHIVDSSELSVYFRFFCCDVDA